MAAKVKCKVCGGVSDVAEGKKVAVCDMCGTHLIVSEAALLYSKSTNTASATEDGFLINDTILEKYTAAGEKVVIPDGVTIIGTDAFADCGKLKSVTIPDSVTSIGDNAFMGCSSLTDIHLPYGLKYIGAHAFQNCVFLKKVVIPESVLSLGAGAFENCIGLSEAMLGRGLNAIESKTFCGCSALESIDIPSSVLSLGFGAFQDCTHLKNVSTVSGLTKVGSSAFEGCTSLESIRFQSDVTEIGVLAFYGCINLHICEAPSCTDEMLNKAFAPTKRNVKQPKKKSIDKRPLERKREGCFIATAVYGGYDAPQVLRLRRFRDDVLLPTAAGRNFVRLYYAVSPPVAEKLKKFRLLSRFVRGILDNFIKIWKL